MLLACSNNDGAPMSTHDHDMPSKCIRLAGTFDDPFHCPRTAADEICPKITASEAHKSNLTAHLDGKNAGGDNTTAALGCTNLAEASRGYGSITSHCRCASVPASRASQYSVVFTALLPGCGSASLIFSSNL